MEGKLDADTPHYVAGDFNTPSRADLHHESRCENEWWQLNDRWTPTHNDGGVLEEILLKPGIAIPTEWFPLRCVRTGTDKAKLKVSSSRRQFARNFHLAITFLWRWRSRGGR